MNWTGGRLQRHSISSRGNATKSLRAVQKQHFTKKRLVARNGRGNSVSPIKLLGINAATSKREDEIRRKGKKNDGEQEMSRSFNGHEESGRGKEDIEAIRRNLLKRNDWANLSLSRPLKMTFTSSRSERDNLAKRRRLTEMDRNRLTTRDSGDGYTCRISEPRRRSSSMFDTDAISIRIDQPRMTRGLSATPASQTRTMRILSHDTSNESMLFDGEERHRRTQSVLVECSGIVRDTDVESVQQPMSQEMVVSDSQAYEDEEERGIPEENDEESTMVTSETSVPLPVLQPGGSFKRNEYGQMRYNPPDQQYVEHPPINSEQREDLLTSSSPVKPRAKQTQVPLWIPESIEADPGVGSKFWQRAAMPQPYPWTSRLIHQPRNEEYIPAADQPVTRDSVHRFHGRTSDRRVQRNLFIDQEGHVSIHGATERQSMGSNPSPAKNRDKPTQSRLRLNNEGHVVISSNKVQQVQESTRIADQTNTPGVQVEPEKRKVTLSRQVSAKNHGRSQTDGDEIWKNFVLGG